jgi:hypothetical protein
MPVATKGLTLSKEDALGSLTDVKGNHIEFEEQEDGSYISKPVESESGNYTYTYSFVPQTTMVIVSVIKKSKEEAKKEKEEELKASAPATTKKTEYSKKSY